MTTTIARVHVYESDRRAATLTVECERVKGKGSLFTGYIAAGQWREDVTSTGVEYKTIAYKIGADDYEAFTLGGYKRATVKAKADALNRAYMFANKCLETWGYTSRF